MERRMAPAPAGEGNARSASKYRWQTAEPGVYLIHRALWLLLATLPVRRHLCRVTSGVTHARPRRETVQKIDQILCQSPQPRSLRRPGGVCAAVLPPPMRGRIGLAGAGACEECPGAPPGPRLG